MRWGAVVDSRRTVLYAAALAFLLRLPGLTRPVRPDEAGWFLVARTWHPSADSVYGEHFVDRPPSLIGLVHLTDQLGGVVTLRVLGALAAATIVVLAAKIGSIVADEVAGRWSAVVVAALTTSPLIDPVAAKGELLALPLLGLAMWAALLAVGSACREPRGRTRLRGRPRRGRGPRTEAEPGRRPRLRRSCCSSARGGGDRPAGAGSRCWPPASPRAQPCRCSRPSVGRCRRGPALRALVHRLRLPLRRRPGDRGEHQHQAGRADRAAAGDRSRRRSGRDRGRFRRALPGALDREPHRSRSLPARC